MTTGSLNGFSASFDTRVLIQRLQWMGGTVLPDTVAIALNETADAITERSKANVRRKLTVRTPFTVNSIRTKSRARGRNVNRMFARTGTISSYLPQQNVGGIVRARGRTHAIATVESRIGKSLQNRVSPRYSINNLGPSRARNTRTFFGRPKNWEGPSGIWLKYINNAGKRAVRFLRRLDHPTIDIPASNWFNDAINAHGRLVGARFKRAAERRLAQR